MPQRETNAKGVYKIANPMERISQGNEPTNVLLQCKTIALKTSAKINAEVTLYLVRCSA
jgi:hypothetical protein